LFLLFIFINFSFAQDTTTVKRKAVIFDEIVAKIGLFFGGAMPLPLPGNIVEVEDYSPVWLPALEIEGIRWLNPASPKWGVSAALRSEYKGMSTTAKVKEYEMHFGDFSGRFTGTVDSKIRAHYFTIPLTLYRLLGKESTLQAGAYYAYLFSGEFTGAAYNGDLNTGTGMSAIGDPEDYDFSKEMRGYDVGLRFGVSTRVYERIVATVDLTWSLTPIFPEDFEGVSYEMQNIFGSLAVGYHF
jgi:hypothetical protein